MSWDLLFDTPWWLPAGLAIMGIAVWMSGNKRRDKTLMNLGYVVAAAALIVTAVSYFVLTDLEKAEAFTNRFVQAVVDQKLDFARDLLDPHAHLSVAGGAIQYADREQVMAAADRADELFGLQSATITSVRTEASGSQINVWFDCISVQDATMGRPLPTSWEFEYHRQPEGLKLWRITLTRVQGITPGQVSRQFPVIPR